MKHITLTAMLLLGACTSYNANYAVNNMVSGDPADGRLLTAQRGDTVIRQGRYATVSAIRVLTDVKVGIAGENRIHPGYYVKVGEDEKSEFFEPEAGPSGGRITKSVIADPVKGLQAYKATPTLCTVTVLNTHDCRKYAEFNRVDRLVIASDSIQQHLVYAGRADDVLTFGYVESANALPRSAADGRVQHDLSKSRSFDYKGMRFDIVDADAETITYRITGTDQRAG